MFDPHRTRRSDSRYFTRKGQVLQASRVNINPIIDQRLVPIYANYIVKNGILEPPPPPPAPIAPIEISGISINHDIYLFSNMTKHTTSTVNLYYTAEGYKKVIIVFYKDTNGNHYLKVTALAEGATYNETINNNVECYFYAVSNTYSTDQNSLDTVDKGIVDKLAESDILVFRGRSLSLTSDIPLSII